MVVVVLVVIVVITVMVIAAITVMVMTMTRRVNIVFLLDADEITICHKWGAPPEEGHSIAHHSQPAQGEEYAIVNESMIQCTWYEMEMKMIHLKNHQLEWEAGENEKQI